MSFLVLELAVVVGYLSVKPQAVVLAGMCPEIVYRAVGQLYSYGLRRVVHKLKTSHLSLIACVVVKLDSQSPADHELKIFWRQ